VRAAGASPARARRARARRSHRDSGGCSARSRRRSRRRARERRAGACSAGGACRRPRPAREMGRIPVRRSAAMSPRVDGRSGRTVRASLAAAILRRWPLSATSEDPEARGLGDCGRS
jgi:hypothetical protein